MGKAVSLPPHRRDGAARVSSEALHGDPGQLTGQTDKTKVDTVSNSIQVVPTGFFYGEHLAFCGITECGAGNNQPA
ncbi:hypothetical protein E5288_WYG016289 [Bos mutus]|uniref:Uncharacterized protein n=1 Tax=Bos mutus TaxID=72004 RepID=A0A6B0RK47_9CETA|nr:hypothetical protein [Bos mutus]